MGRRLRSCSAPVGVLVVVTGRHVGGLRGVAVRIEGGLIDCRVLGRVGYDRVLAGDGSGRRAHWIVERRLPVGSRGIDGLAAALDRRPGDQVIVSTKSRIAYTSSRWVGMRVVSQSRIDFEFTVPWAVQRGSNRLSGVMAVLGVVLREVSSNTAGAWRTA
jgi:hypothetical protein